MKEKIYNVITTIIGYSIGIFMIINPLCWICIYNIKHLGKNNKSIKLLKKIIKIAEEDNMTMADIYIDNHIEEIGRTLTSIKSIEAKLLSYLIYKSNNEDRINVQINLDKLVLYSLGIMPLFKIQMANTIAHELTHVKQYNLNKNIFDGYVCALTSYRDYKKQPIEVEARKAGRDFCRRNLWKILRA